MEEELDPLSSEAMFEKHKAAVELGLQFTQSVLVMCQHLFVLGDLLLVELDDALGGGQLGRFAIQSRDALPALL
eukprot:gene10932-17819_t